jgi:hypothetical protein
LRLAVGFAIAKVAALLALAVSLGSCATFRDAWAEEEQSWQKYCAVPPNDAQLISCSCMNPATPGCYPILEDDSDNPSQMAKMIRRHARWHRQQAQLIKGAQ